MEVDRSGKKVFIRNCNRRLLVSCLLCGFVVSLYPIAFLYLNNIQEASLPDVLEPALFSMGVMLGIILLVTLLVRDMVKVPLLSALVFLLVANYGFLEGWVGAVLPRLKFWHLAPISVVILLHICYFLFKKLPVSAFEVGKDVTIILFGVLILVNGVFAVPKLVNKISDNGVEQAALSLASEDVQGEYPNIYYILTDEYSNFPVLEQFYDYPNSAFKSYLEDSGFTISLDSYNESTATVIVTTNNLNLDYVVMDINNYAPHRVDPKLFQELDRYGYDISFDSPSPSITWRGSIGNQTKSATTLDGLGLAEIFYKQTLLYPSLSGKADDAFAQQFYRQFDFLNQSISGQATNQFVYVHIGCPHLPFVFDEDGDYVGIENRNNTADGQYYLGQLKYTTKYLQASIEHILAEDPNSIIILQSDHSNRNIGVPMGGESLATFETKTNILNAVYYGGETFPEIHGQSAVNTLRAVLNRALGTGYDMVEVPNYD